MQQDEALNLLKMGKNIFLTGAAGSGKTYVLNQYIRYLRVNDVAVAVTASTGIAATHLQGMTIHSWSGIGVREKLTPEDLEKILKVSRIIRNYKKTKVLVIDEISMLHKNYLDMVDTTARHILVPDKPFGGLQVVLCGDFFQLPPIVSTFVKAEKPFAYEADSWKSGDFHVCYLHEQHRQGDDPLLNILNEIRSGMAGEQTKVPLRTRYKKEPQGATKPTKLYTRNINVDAINEQELAKLASVEKLFTMSKNGFDVLVESLKKSCLALEFLSLKIGAQAMFIKNDTASRYVNGTRCVVIDFDRREGWPVVKTHDGDVIVVYPEEWKYEENGVSKATITQVPLRLAWAITIHKSQGMTLDTAEIDLGDAFEPGMGYVALSRVKRLSGLKLMNLNEMALKVHPQVILYDQNLKRESEDQVKFLQTLSEQDIIRLHEKTLTQQFGVKKEKKENTINKKIVRKKEKATIESHIKTLEMLKEDLSPEAIAEKRALSLETIMTHLEKLKGLQLLDDVLLTKMKKMVTKEDFEVIYNELIMSADGRLAPIYEKFSGKYTYAVIRQVRLFA